LAALTKCSAAFFLRKVTGTVLTVALVLFGIKLQNFHIEFLKYLPAVVAKIINDGLKMLTNPLEFKLAFGGVGLDIMFGSDTALVPVAGSRAITPVAPGTIVPTPAHPDVDPSVPTTPAEPDIDWTEPTIPDAPSDTSGLSPLEKALAGN
jgi:hypothetical protein